MDCTGAAAGTALRAAAAAAVSPAATPHCTRHSALLQRIDNTSLRDEPYVFRLGAHEARSFACCRMRQAGRGAPQPHACMPRCRPPLGFSCSSPCPPLPPSLQAIPAFEEAVAGMRVGGVRRIEVLGELPQLSYPRDRAERFAAPFK